MVAVGAHASLAEVSSHELDFGPILVVVVVR